MTDERTAGPALTLWGLGYLVLVLGVGIATAVAWPIYAGPRLVLVAAVGTAIGIGSALLPALTGRPGWLTPLLAAVGYLAAVVPVAVPSALGAPPAVLGGLRDGVLGLVVGWKQLLTLALPLGEYQAVLVPFFGLVTGGSLLAAWLIVRERRATPLAAGVVLVLVAFGLVFGSSETSASWTLAGWRLPAVREIALVGAVVVLSVGWLVGRARLRRRRAMRAVQASAGVRPGSATRVLRARRRLVAAVLVLVAVATGLALAPLAEAATARQALRDRVDPYLVLQRQPSPLSAYRAAFQGAAYGETLFTVAPAPGASTGASGGVDRLRIATLGSYDGEEFRVAGGEDAARFTRLPGGAAGGELTITLGAASDGIWVPIPAGLAAAPRFEGDRAGALADGFYLDAAGGAAIDVAPRDDGTRGLAPGDRYAVAPGPTPDAGGFAAAAGGDPLLDPEEHPELAAWVARQAVPRTGAGLADLVERLRARGYLSHALAEGPDSAGWIADLQERGAYSFAASYSGHSTARIEALFRALNEQERRAGSDADPALLVAAPGDDEQFAVAAALLARALGFDSRVVLGVRLGATPGDLGVPACTGTCTGGELTAWVEVRSPTGGWAVLDATPQFELAPIALDEGEKLPENPTIPEVPRSDLLEPPSAQQSDDDAAPLESPAPPWWEPLLPALRTVGVVGLAALLVALPALAVLIVKRLRRRDRRRQAVPEVALVGAWSELMSRYADAGLAPPDRATRTEIARALGRPRAADLAERVDAAVFGEHPPDAAQAAAAWRLVDEELDELRAVAGLPPRMRAALSLRSFLRDLAPVRHAVLRAAPRLVRLR
ncbi:MAG: DUF4129 domain-containing protein [Actinomycetales bacterium]|nr:DUF4129 domain-containing protein [Actinomycetales bacterium]